MAIVYNTKIVRDGLVFSWDGMNPKCWDGSSSTHYDLVGGGSGTNTSNTSLVRSNNHVFFDNSALGNRECDIVFPNANVTVPTGDEGTWIFCHYWQDAGSIDHPAFGKETGSGWNGINGFVFGTGWGVDGPRWGIGGQGFAVYSVVGTNTGDYRQAWQMYAVTYQRNTTNGLKTYLCDSNGKRLVNESNTGDYAIGSSSESLRIGSTNYRGGNFNGYFDFVHMWNRALSETEINFMLDTFRDRFGL